MEPFGLQLDLIQVFGGLQLDYLDCFQAFAEPMWLHLDYFVGPARGGGAQLAPINGKKCPQMPKIRQISRESR